MYLHNVCVYICIKQINTKLFLNASKLICGYSRMHKLGVAPVCMISSLEFYINNMKWLAALYF